MTYTVTSVGDEPAPTPTPDAATSPEEEVTPVETDAPKPDATEVPEVPDAATDDKPSTDPEPDAEPELFWGDTPVEVELPEEIAAAFADKGIDGKAVLAELFAKGGKFELSKETRDKLDAAYGKPLVDGYLGLYKRQNDAALADHHASEAALAEEIKSNSGELDSLLTEAGGWDALSEWAGQNLEEKDLAAINAVMSLDVKHWAAQRVVIKSLISQMGSGTAPLKLLTDDMSGGAAPGTSTGLPGQLTMSEFQSIMGSDKYRSDRGYAAQIDQIRRDSQKSGIR